MMAPLEVQNGLGILADHEECMAEMNVWANDGIKLVISIINNKNQPLLILKYTDAYDLNVDYLDWNVDAKNRSHNKPNVQ
jgi:hypothetical protein